VADRHVNSEELYVPPRQPETGESVAIVGAGPSGLAAAYFLLREGHACTVFDRNTMAGGSLRQAVQQGLLPADALEAETRFLQQLGMSFQAGVEVGRAVLLDDLRRDYDAVLLSLGELTKGEAETLGLAATKSGIQTDSGTGLTCLERVFAAGSAVRPVKQLVRAMNEGRLVAGAIHRLLSGQPVLLPQKQFSSVMGRLEKPELELLTAVAPAIGRVSPASGAAAGLAFGEARTEASRCLHCDCRAAGNCALQYYAARYEAEPNRFRHQRRQFDQDLRHGHVIFEPGKCILCGICVRLAELAREPLGLTFIGRGFEVRIGAPLDHTIAEGLQKAAEECVKHCPTGALAFRDFVVPSLPPLPAAAGKGPAAAPPAP
jgi:ferredoxin